MARFSFRLPDIGEGIAEAEIVAWHVAVGDHVTEDQPVADVMTDKATVEICAPVNGTVVAIYGEIGGMMATGATLIEFETESAVAAAIPPVATATPEPAAAAPALAPAVVVAAKPLAAPAVRQRASDLGLELAEIFGTGPAGQITHQDLDHHLRADRTPPGSAAPVAGPVVPGGARDSIETVKLVGLRRKIAEKMLLSAQRIPHFSYIEEVDVTALEALRQTLNGRTTVPARPRLTLLPFLIIALVRVLPQFPQINATFDDETGIVSRHAAVHLGMATQTPNGLIVPVIRHAETRDLWGLAAEITRLANAARDGSAAAAELSGSTITLTSLGTLGGLAHTPIINHPEVAIFGPNRIVERPVIRNGQVTIAKMMNISSSFDHRVVDGADAAAFIQALKQRIEEPALLFVG